MPTTKRDFRRGDRVRAAICVALLDAHRNPRTIPQLVTAITNLGLDLGPNANKIVADAARWEIRRGHVRHVGRGVFAAGRIPESTAYYMRVRLARYVADPTKSYGRPNSYPRIFGEPRP